MRGLINVQYAVKANQVFVIEANPRAVAHGARSWPRPPACRWPRWRPGSWPGPTLAELRAEGLLVAPVVGDHVAVKEAVLPFGRFPDADAVLGPEMRSTGEVMGIDLTVGPGLRQEPAGGGQPAARRAAPCSCRWPTATRRWAWPRPRSSSSSASPSPPPRARPQLPRPTTACRWPPWWPSWASPTGTDAVELIASGQVQLVVNSPRGSGAPGRRRPHPRRGRRPPGAAADHRRGRAGRGQGHGRLGPPPAAGAHACRSTNAATTS